jgi:hypothetical protein
MLIDFWSFGTVIILGMFRELSVEILDIAVSPVRGDLKVLATMLMPPSLLFEPHTAKI